MAYLDNIIIYSKNKLEYKEYVYKCYGTVTDLVRGSFRT